MGLLEKAIKYRTGISSYPKKGLLNRALNYLQFKSSDLNTINEDSLIETEELNYEDPNTNKNDIKNKYYEIIDVISNQISTLSLDNKAYITFNDIIAKNFNFSKSALLIYSPAEKKFKFWHGKNIDDQSTKILAIDFSFNDIYKKMITDNYVIIYKDSSSYKRLQEILSVKDYNESDFQIYVPFIFASRIIGIFLGLKLKDGRIPDKELIDSLEIIGRLNGSLLYNIYQQETVVSKKGNS